MFRASGNLAESEDSIHVFKDEKIDVEEEAEAIPSGQLSLPQQTSPPVSDPR